jgi:hypothetical protein
LKKFWRRPGRAALEPCPPFNRNYGKSDLLQVIRVLKNYQLFKDPQMELFRTGRRSKRPRRA